MSDRKFLDTGKGGKLHKGYPYDMTPKPPRSHTGAGNPDISPMGEGELNGRPAAMDPPNLGKGKLADGLAFCVPMDEEYEDYIIQDD